MKSLKEINTHLNFILLTAMSKYSAGENKDKDRVIIIIIIIKIKIIIIVEEVRTDQVERAPRFEFLYYGALVRPV